MITLPMHLQDCRYHLTWTAGSYHVTTISGVKLWSPGRQCVIPKYKLKVRLSSTEYTDMPEQQRQSALSSIPRVIFWPTWDNAVAVSYLPKVSEVPTHYFTVLTGNRVLSSSSATPTFILCSGLAFCLPSC